MTRNDYLLTTALLGPVDELGHTVSGFIPLSETDFNTYTIHAKPKCVQPRRYMGTEDYEILLRGNLIRYLDPRLGDHKNVTGK
jgi:hypothetical protein